MAFSFLKISSKKYYGGLVLLGLYAFITWLRFHEWRAPCFWGDDLHSYILFFGKHLKEHSAYLPFLQDDLKLPFEKVRFIFHAITYLEFLLFKKEVWAYFLVNVILHSINGYLVCLLAYWFSRNFWTAATLGLCAIISHFGIFDVTQITGNLESVSLMCCLLTILSVLQAQKTYPFTSRASLSLRLPLAPSLRSCPFSEPLRRSEEGRTSFLSRILNGYQKTALDSDCLWSEKWKWLALLFAFLAFNTHERYVVLLPWLALFFVLHPGAGSVWQRLSFAAVEGLLLLSNIVVKIFFYHVRFFQGTGGAPLTMDLVSIKKLAAEGFCSIFGLNHGPEYLAGIDWMQFPSAVQKAAILMAAVSLIFVGIALLPWRTKKRFTIAWPIYLFLLTLLLLAPGILTIRIEQRWELGPFDMILLIMACGVGKLLSGRLSGRFAGILFACFVIGFGIEEWYLTRGFNKVFLLYEQKAVALVKKKIIDAHAVPLRLPLLFVAYPGNGQWGLINGGLFLVYEGQARSVFFVEHIKDIVMAQYPPETQIFLWKGRESLENITSHSSPAL